MIFRCMNCWYEIPFKCINFSLGVLCMFIGFQWNMSHQPMLIPNKFNNSMTIIHLRKFVFRHWTRSAYNIWLLWLIKFCFFAMLNENPSTLTFRHAKFEDWWRKWQIMYPFVSISLSITRISSNNRVRDNIIYFLGHHFFIWSVENVFQPQTIG